jgi:8-oxo-dGTP diphosphatase
MSIWGWTGRILHFISWPALFLLLNNSQRTRVVVHYQGKLLVVKDWLGDGTWKLPGGGIHQGEQAIASAVRELKEETGIEITANQLQLHGEIETINHNLKTKLVVFSLQLPQAVPTKKQKLEILALDWISSKDLLEKTRISDNTRTILEKYGFAALS